MEQRAALVTGAGSGIGESIARRLAEAGLLVAVNDIDPKRARRVAGELEADGFPATAITGDVSDEQQVDRVFTETAAAFGPPTVLVNNAGVADVIVPTHERDVASWQRVLDIDLRGPYLCSRRAALDMLAAGHGRIVNISSIVGLRGLPMRSAYGPAKAGLINLTMVLALEWAASGVTVNAVAPGYIRTAMLDNLIERGSIDEDGLNARIPMGRLGASADVAAAVAFLASDDASYITGVTLPVDGGWTSAL